jgi:hypothetical protein
MLILATTAIIIGALLGQRFKVFILVPAIAISSAATFGIGIAHNSSLWSILLATVLAISALQMGYLGGVIIRFVSAGVQVHKDSHGIIATVQRPAR